MRRSPPGLVALLLAACKGPEAPPPPPAPATVAVEPSAPTPALASAPEAAPTAPPSPCGDLLDHNRKTLPADNDARPQNEADLTASCYATARGAWGLRLLDWKREGSPDDYPTYLGTLEVVHFQEGRAVTMPVDGKTGGDGRYTLRSGLDYSTVLKPQLTDLNGDGEPELFVRVDQKEHEGPYYRQARLYTAGKDGAVALYKGLPAQYEELEDVDKDGTMDLIFYPYSEEREAACSGFGFQWRGPAFLAHGRPGGAFATDDAAAREFLQRSCPKDPPKKRGKDASDSGDRDGPPPELCARLWGKSEKEALALLKKQCRAPKGNEACQTPPGVCSDFHEREATLKKPPPLVLGR